MNIAYRATDSEGTHTLAAVQCSTEILPAKTVTLTMCLIACACSMILGQRLRGVSQNINDLSSSLKDFNVTHI